MMMIQLLGTMNIFINVFLSFLFSQISKQSDQKLFQYFSLQQSCWHNWQTEPYSHSTSLVYVVVVIQKSKDYKKHKSNRPGGSHKGIWTSSWSAVSPLWTQCVGATVWAEHCCFAASDPSAEPPSSPSDTTSCRGVLLLVEMPIHTWNTTE